MTPGREEGKVEAVVLSCWITGVGVSSSFSGSSLGFSGSLGMSYNEVYKSGLLKAIKVNSRKDYEQVMM